MELNLAPQMPDQTVSEGEGGGYYTWSISAVPFLGQAKLAAGKLVLQPLGFALPHYADFKKIGFVLQGCCVVGVISPDSTTEKVVKVTKGDAIPVELGAVSWWYNDGDSDVVVVFLGETSDSNTAGPFNYYFLAGALGMLGGFSPDFLARGFGISVSESKTLFKTQNATVITKLKAKLNISDLVNNNPYRNEMVFNLKNALPSVNVKDGGSLVSATAENFPLLSRVNLSGNLVKLESGAMLTPGYTADSSYEIGYVASGSARIQIVGLNGQLALDDRVEAGHVFVLPKFFVGSLIADTEGIEFVSTVTSSEPKLLRLAGVESVWKALSPSVLQASLNLSTEDTDIFKDKIVETTAIIPPKKH
ncbi:PREDICTED: 12S seed storage protein CRD-like isoform X1 [Ipomoea nil]|uniref:12S seed storage protein CRD-like isoform X1 n=1 Tax=Ipomoea nil TaxID=35883 RepID=UPI0009009A5E|nr:PREDICTED: 12S seed storage protein CRD-like isoform X1 [Ipomoea nil]